MNFVYAFGGLSFGDLINQRREDLGLTVAEVCERTGISRTNLRALEAGTNDNPTMKACIALSDVLDMRIGSMALALGMKH